MQINIHTVATGDKRKQSKFPELGLRSCLLYLKTAIIARIATPLTILKFSTLILRTQLDGFITCFDMVLPAIMDGNIHLVLQLFLA